MPELPKIFLSYSHADERWKKDLVRQLKILELEEQLEIWDDSQIAAGDDWQQEIATALDEATAAVFLISDHFLTSPFIRDVEVKRLLERRADDGIRIFPLLVEPCPWQSVSWLSKIQCRPLGGRDLASMKRPQAKKVLSTLAVEIAALLKKPPTAATPSAPSPKPPERPPAPAPEPAKPPDANTDPVLTAWWNHVAEEHRRLADHFERPEQLQILEQAWVEVKVQLDRQHAVLPTPGSKEALAGPMTIDDVLDLEPAKKPGVTGRWLLEGEPGSGKTTLLRHLASRLAAARDRQRVPVFAALPRLVNARQSLLDYLAEGFTMSGLHGLPEMLRQAGAEGRLVILLDSLDEVPTERRDGVATLLRRLPNDFPGCPIVVASRPLGQGEVPDDYRKLDLLPLAPERQREFLEKWLGYGEVDDPARAAADALAHFERHDSLAALAGNPLYLTLLAVLLEGGVAVPERRVELYDAIFELLFEGTYKKNAEPMPLEEDVREALGHLAHGMTVDDLPAEPAKRLERRLAAQELEALRQRLAAEPRWRRLRTFLTDVYERTHILGPHDGKTSDWRFWHRTFREALTAEKLEDLYRAADGEAAILELVSKVDEDDKDDDAGRWAEPLSLLAGRLGADGDQFVVRLTRSNGPLGRRALATAQGLKRETLLEVLGLCKTWQERREVYTSLPNQLEAEACLSLIDEQRQGTRNGNDLFFLHRSAQALEGRAPKASGELLDRFFDHIPPPEDAELFRSVETPLDGRVALWREIPAGEGWIGSPEGVGDSDERPRHRVVMERSFWLSVVPVTQAQYRVFDPERAGEELDKPVVRVTWYEAVSFCRWLATQPGFARARLPREEEWEYACRAGAETEYWNGDGEAALDAVGWYSGNSNRRLHQVGEKPANPWGLYDVHGNVFEWTSTIWQETAYQGRDAAVHPVDPAVPPADLAGHPGAGRVIRGGCYAFGAVGARCAYRLWNDPDDWFWDRGFRVLVPSPPADP